MTNQDLQLRQLATELTVGPEAPDFNDLHSIGSVSSTRGMPRGPLLAAAAAVVVALLIASVALVRTGGSGSTTAPADNESGAISTFEERLAECDTLPLSALSADGQPTKRFQDVVTKETAEIDVREVCRFRVESTPAPGSGIMLGVGVENGELVARYWEKVVTPSDDDGGFIVTQGEPVPEDVAAEAVARYQAAR